MLCVLMKTLSHASVKKRRQIGFQISHFGGGGGGGEGGFIFKSHHGNDGVKHMPKLTTWIAETGQWIKCWTRD